MLRNLNVLYTNCDQLLNKFDELNSIIKLNKPDIILLVEVIPKAQKSPILAPSLHIPHYTLYTDFNPDASPPTNTRGIIMYVADSINSKEVSFTTEFSEQMWVKIELLNNSYLLVGAMYRSPSSNPNDSIAKLCCALKQVLESRPPYLLVVGDFNLPGIDWCNEKFSGNSYEQEFYDTVQDGVLFQHVHEPTRFRPGSAPHILFTNEENMVESINYCSGLGSSDHLCLNFFTNYIRIVNHSRTGQMNYRI